MTGKERVYALLNGDRYDRMPVGFWMHFPKECFYGEKSVKAHLEYFEKTKTDIAKVMTEHLMPCDHSIQCAKDWKNVPVYDENAPFIQAQAELLSEIFTQRTDLAPMATLHGVVASASHTLLGAPEYDSIGRYAQMYHLRTNPDAFEAGLRNIAQSLCSMEDAFIKAGAEGIYYAALGGESDVFTAEEHAKYIAPLDRLVMQHAYDAGAKFVALHICKPRADITRFSDYPCDIVNWGVRESGTSLREGAEIFRDKIILGGFDHREGPMIEGDMEGIAAQTRELAASMPDIRLILGSDCTLPGGLDYANIAAVAECLDAIL